MPTTTVPPLTNSNLFSHKALMIVCFSLYCNLKFAKAITLKVTAVMFKQNSNLG